MTKEEAIQEAYGEYWDKLPLEAQKEALENNGWVNKYYLSIDFRNQNYNECKQIDIVTGQSWAYRPKSLQGIENNNGWTKIESEADLPKDNGSYFTKTNYSKETIERDYPIFTKSMSIEDERKWWLENITHYQPIIKPNEPLY